MWILANLGMDEEVIELISRPGGPGAPAAGDLLLLGRLLMSQGNEWSAIEPLQLAAARLPDSEAAWMRLALALHRVGDEPAARKAGSRAVLLASRGSG